jgi:hypothetical protein
MRGEGAEPSDAAHARRQHRPPDDVVPVREPDAKRVIRGWSDELRHGHLDAASRYFKLPSVVSTTGIDAAQLMTRADVKKFNDGFPCGAKLVKVRRSVEHFVIGTFTLTERPGKTCDGPGNQAEVAFLINHHRIEKWLRAPDPVPEPTPTPKPTKADST